MRRLAKKTSLLVSIAVFIFLVFAGSYFLLIEILDPNNYKKELGRRIEKAIGRKVYIGGASLKFKNGIGVKLGPVKIFGQNGMNEIFSAESVVTVIRVKPLLEKEIRIKRVILDQPVFYAYPDEIINNVKNQPTGPASGEDIAAGKDATLSRSQGNFSWRKVLPVIGSASQFNVKNGTLNLVEKNKVSKERVLETVSFDLWFKKEASADVPYTFELASKLQYKNSEKGTLSLEGGITNVPADLDLLKFGFDGKIKGENLKQELLGYLNNFQYESPLGIPVGLDLDISFKAGKDSTIETNGRLRLLPPPGIYQKTSTNIHSADLDFWATYQNNSIILKKCNLRFDDMKFMGKATVKEMDRDNPLLSVNLSANSVNINRLKENFFLKGLSGKTLEASWNYINSGIIHLGSLHYKGPWKWIRDGRFEEIRKGLSFSFSLEGMEGAFEGPKGPVPFGKSKGRFLYEKDRLTFEDVSLDLMGAPISSLSGVVNNLGGLPNLEKARLEARLELENLEALFKNIFGSEGPPLIRDMAGSKGPVATTLRFSFPLNDRSQIKYSGEAVLKDVSLFHRDLKKPLKGINGKIIFSSFKKAGEMGISERTEKSSEEQEGIFIEFSNFSGAIGQSSLNSLHGIYQEAKGQNSLLSLFLNGNVDILEIEDILKPFSQGPSVIPKNFAPASGRAEVDLKVEGQLNDLKTRGSLNLINTSFNTPLPGVSPKNITARLRFYGSSILIDEFTGVLNGPEISLSGELNNYLTDDPEFNLNIKLNGNSESLKALFLDNVWVKGPGFFKESIGPGMLSLKTNLKGTWDMIATNSVLDFTGVPLKYEGKTKKEKGEKLIFSFSGLYKKDQSFTMDQYDFYYLDNHFSGADSIINLKNNRYKINVNTTNFEFARLLDLFSITYDSTLTGTIGTELTIHSPMAGSHIPFLQGKVTLNKLGYHFNILPNAFKETSGVFYISGEKLNINSLLIRYKDSEVHLSGVYEGLKSPRYTLNLDSLRFQMSDILPITPITILWIREFLSSSGRFRNTVGQVNINVQNGSYQFLRWKSLKGLLTIKDKVFTLKDAIAEFPGGKLYGSGNIGFLTDKGMDFLLNLRTFSSPAEEVMYVLGPGFDSSLRGDFYLKSSIGSEGYNWGEVRRSLYGKLDLLIKSGAYNKHKLLSGLGGIFKLDGSQEEKKEKEEGKSVSFHRIKGKFEFNEGIATTDNFSILTRDRKTSMIGKLLLGDKKLDLTVGIAPWAQADKIVSNIPLVGPILTGGSDKSLLTSYYGIKGDMANPKVSALPFKSLGKKLEGMLLGIIGTPQDIQEFLIPELGSKGKAEN